MGRVSLKYLKLGKSNTSHWYFLSIQFSLFSAICTICLLGKVTHKSVCGLLKKKNQRSQFAHPVYVPKEGENNSFYCKYERSFNSIMG